MILHIVNDEKFIDMAFRIFEEVYPNKNECVVLISKSKELKFIKSTPCTVVNIKKANIKKLALSFKKYNAVIIHSLNESKFELLKNIPKNITTVWVGFGFDYYDLIVKQKTDLFDIKTKKLFVQHQVQANSNSKFIKNERYVLVRGCKKIKRYLLKWVESKRKQKIINNIDFFAPVLTDEYRMIQQAMHHKFKPHFIDWNYGTLEDDLIRGYENISLTSNNILVGNSADYTNNHVDAFKVISALSIDNRKIITPLSYGIPIYREEILNVGLKMFNKNFMPLVDFMPIDKYLNIICSCSIVIMNHIRQQALGNIIIMLYLGAVVFLKQKNPIYTFLQEKGIFILSIEELEKKPNLINFQLSAIDIAKNKEALKIIWSRKAAQYKTKQLINTIFENNNASFTRKR